MHLRVLPSLSELWRTHVTYK